MFEFPYLFASPWPWWLIVASAGGAGVLTWRGYRRRKGEVSPGRLLLLRGLRLAGWGALCFCLLQPIHRSFKKEIRASRITVLVDGSESMSFADQANGSTRMARVREWLGDAKAGSGLLEQLDRSFDVRLEMFSEGARPLPRVDDLNTEGQRTDLAQGLGDAFGRLKGPDAGGAILITDGADTVRGDWARVAGMYRRAGIPIYAVGIGAVDVPDLAITQVRCRRTVSKDTLVRVEVEVTRRGIPEGAYIVRITREDRLIKEASVDLQGDKAAAIFEFLPEEQGFLEYRASVEIFPGELITSNNSFAFGLVAFSRRLRVLYMEGSQHKHGDYGRPVWAYKWEHEFLVDALEEDAEVEVDVLFREHPGDYEGEIKTVRDGYPRTKKDLYAYDVIINSDIPKSHFNDDQIKWTTDFVARHGGGFIMIGGWDAFGEGKYAKSAFDRMLPVEMNKHDTHADGQEFRWRVTDEGWKHPVMEIVKDPRKNRDVWEMLNTLGGTSLNPGPAFFGFSKTTRAKPAATVLAVIDDEELEGAYGPMVLVSVQPFGRGRSMAFTTDSTGGWGAIWEDAWGDDPNDPDRRNLYYKTFWKNAIRWLAHYRMRAPNQLVQFETDRLVYGRGEIPIARVKALSPDYDPTHEAKVQLKITDPEGHTSSVNVFPRYEEPGVYERKLELTKAGRYQILAHATLQGEDLGEDKGVLQVRAATEELRRLSQDVAALEKLAEASGGAYLPFERKEEVLDLLRQDTHVIQRHRDEDLWDNGWVFIAMIGLLTAEWYFRKQSGLP